MNETSSFSLFHSFDETARSQVAELVPTKNPSSSFTASPTVHLDNTFFQNERQKISESTLFMKEPLHKRKPLNCGLNTLWQSSSLVKCRPPWLRLSGPPTMASKHHGEYSG
jgi:hypothetical protein